MYDVLLLYTDKKKNPSCQRTLLHRTSRDSRSVTVCAISSATRKAWWLRRNREKQNFLSPGSNCGISLISVFEHGVENRFFTLTADIFTQPTASWKYQFSRVKIDAVMHDIYKHSLLQSPFMNDGSALSQKSTFTTSYAVWEVLYRHFFLLIAKTCTLLTGG